MDERTLIVIPTYNERGNIERLIAELLHLPYPLDILVVDDNSPDGTGKIVDEIAGEIQLHYGDGCGFFP